MIEKEPDYEYLLICPHCSNKKFSTGKDINHLHEVNVAQPPLRADGKSREVKVLPKKFKCEKCGYLYRITRLPKPETDKEEPKEPEELK